MRQKDMYFIDCVNSICTTVPRCGSKEDLMLQKHELEVLPSHPSYPKQAMHVYAHNSHCDSWNDYMLDSLKGDKFLHNAKDQKKDNLSNIANVIMPDKPSQTGNLRKTLQVKVGARVMITTNIDVSDGLTNGATGSVTNIVRNQDTSNIDHESIGQDAKRTSKYKHINRNTVPILPLQVSFNVKGKDSFNATRTQFPLKLAWAVTIHKCQGLTLPEIVVDMSQSKERFSPGQAYVAFSRVCELDKLHLIKYTWEQIKVSPSVAGEMDRLHKKVLPKIPQNLFYSIDKQLKMSTWMLGIYWQNFMTWETKIYWNKWI